MGGFFRAVELLQKLLRAAAILMRDETVEISKLLLRLPSIRRFFRFTHSQGMTLYLLA